MELEKVLKDIYKDQLKNGLKKIIKITSNAF